MAIKNNLYPDIQFEEINEIPRPNQIQTNRRLGIVGEFRKGAWNQYRMISTYDDLLRAYGASTHKGSAGVQIAMDQGADDFGIVRVMGAARFATGDMTFTVPVPADVEDGGSLVITVNVYNEDGTLNHSTTATTTTAPGLTKSNLINEVIALINDTAVMNDDVVATVQTTGDDISLRAKNAGLSGNRIKVMVTTPMGVTGTPSSLTALSGGIDGPKTATLTVQDGSATPADFIVFRAKDEGLYGNDLRITTSRGTRTGFFNVFIEDMITGETEQFFDLNVSSVALDVETNDIIALRSSGMIRGKFVGTDFTLKIGLVNETYLTGGSNGSTITDEDYLAALDVLRDEQVNYIMAPGQTSSRIRMKLIQQAEEAEAISGFRIAILNADKGTALEDLDISTADYNTNTGSAVMVTGWLTYANQPRMPRFSVSPDCAYAGHLVATPMQTSPAARSSSPFFQNILEVDTKMTGQWFNAYTKARLEAIIRDPATGGYHCLNGRTLSSDGAWYWVSVRRVTNKIKTDIFANIQWAKSQPNSTIMRNMLSQQLDGIMDLYIQNGIIAATKPSVVSMTNNTLQRIAQGYLRAEVYFAPFFPADHITIGVHRFLSADVAVSF